MKHELKEKSMQRKSKLSKRLCYFFVCVRYQKAHRGKTFTQRGVLVNISR